jgi:hypothetical protein
MSESEIQELTRPVWYGREVNSPELPEGRLGIEFSLADAKSPFGDTILLSATVRLGAPHTETYGGRAPAATEVVAMDAEEGVVYHSSAARIDSAPFRPVPPSPGDPSSMDMVVDEIDSSFNVDLCVHLGLPSEYKKYHVFCWLDQMISAVHDIDVPAVKDREGLGKSSPQPCVSDAIAVSAQPGVMPNDGQKIFLTSAIEKKAPEGATREEKIRQGMIVTGNISSGIFPAESPMPDDVPPYLTLMVRSFIDREFKWCSIPIPFSCVESRSLSFSMNPFYLVDPAQDPQQIFVLAAVGSVLSNILTIEPATYQNL